MCIVLLVRKEVSLMKDLHKLSEGHHLEVWVIKFDPIDETDIFNSVESAFDNFICGNVFVVCIPLTRMLPVHTCLCSRVTSMHIQRF